MGGVFCKRGLGQTRIKVLKHYPSVAILKSPNGGREPDRASEGALSAVLRCAALAAAATNANNRVIKK